MKGTIATLMIMTMLVAACAQTGAPAGKDVSGGTDVGPSTTQLSGATQELKKFTDVEELRAYLQQNRGSQADVYGGVRRGLMMETGAMADIAAPMATASGSPSTATSGAGASDYSQTNVQVAGVDEADYVKNDNKYIYTLSQEKLVIIDAYPATSARIVSKTDIDGTPRELFVNGDRLLVFTEENDQVYAMNEYDFVPSPQYRTQTHALLYDVADRSKPELLHDYAISGNYFQSRMIGDDVNFLVRDGVTYYNEYPILPRVLETKTGAKSTVVKPDIYYFDNPEDSYTFTTVASLNIKGESKEVQAKTFLLGWANTVYVSEKNIYVAYQKNLPYDYGRTANQQRFYDIIVPNLPSGARTRIEAIKADSSLKEYERWEKVSNALEEMYNEMSESEKQDLMKELQEKAADYELKREQERQKSVIHKIGIDAGDIVYKGRGEVPGQLLNQFSLDENDGKLRVATTSYLYTRAKSTMYNNVYILDEGMETSGKLEGLAEDERIYSTRFVGDRLYMVTFKRIDPLFVIGLAGKDPEVLGTLKIPGFSDYLHPYDENHLIGIGKETADNEWGGTSVKGLKVALFDVTNVQSPKQVDMVEIGAAGSDSEALRDHKAFLFDKEKGLLVLPVREVKESYSYDGVACRQGLNCYPYRQNVWQGAYVFTVTQNGFEKRGTISQYAGDEQYQWYWGSPYAVKRSLFLDDVLYTLSDKQVLMNDLGTLGKVGAIELPYTIDRPYPVPMRGTVMIE